MSGMKLPQTMVNLVGEWPFYEEKNVHLKFVNHKAIHVVLTTAAQLRLILIDLSECIALFTCKINTNSQDSGGGFSFLFFAYILLICQKLISVQ